MATTLTPETMDAVGFTGLRTGLTPRTELGAGLNAETLGGLGVEAALCLELGRDDKSPRLPAPAPCTPPIPELEAGRAGGLPHSPRAWEASNGPPTDPVGVDCIVCADCWPMPIDMAMAMFIPPRLAAVLLTPARAGLSRLDSLTTGIKSVDQNRS